MTPNEKCIVKSLVAVAWADGTVEQVEEHIIEGLLAGFDASEEEEKEILEYAKTKRTLATDIPTAEMSDEDKELLLANAALLAHADGDQSEGERELLIQLIKILELDDETAATILDSVKDGALRLGSNILEAVE